MDIPIHLVDFGIGAVFMAAVFWYFQRNNITIPKPDQIAVVVGAIIQAVQDAQYIYGAGLTGQERAAKALELVQQKLDDTEYQLNDPTAQAIIKIVYHALEKSGTLAAKELNKAD